MSKFVDKLKNTSQAVAQPMGFGRGQPVSAKPGILLVASVDRAGVGNLADLVSGADAGLIGISELEPDSKALRECAEAAPDIPWGGWLRGGRWRRSQKIKALGGDFVIFPASTPLGVLENTGVGKIVEVEATLSEGMLRTIDKLPVDGVFLAVEYGDSPSLTWQQLMLFQRFSGLVAKPLLVLVPSKVTAGELKVLWEAGVDGVIIEVGEGQSGGSLRQLREAIDKLSFPSQRRRGRVRALLPHLGGEAEIEGEEEEIPDDL
jgi:hypothetical protein